MSESDAQLDRRARSETVSVDRQQKKLKKLYVVSVHLSESDGEVLCTTRPAVAETDCSLKQIDSVSLSMPIE